MPLAELIEAHPWPSSRPDVPIVEWGWGIDGQSLLEELVDPTVEVVLEIGSLLGGSARFWAGHCPDAHVICVDPWIDVARAEDRPFLKHVPQLVDVVVGTPNGLYDVFLAANWELRHRLVPLRGFSPDRLITVVDHGIQPDVVYVDGSHVYEDVIADLVAARALFPDALICGDDYNWPAVRDAVGYLVTNRGDRLRTIGNTFAIEQTGDGGRRPVRSARPTGPADRSFPMRVAEAVAAELPGRRPGRPA